MSEQPESNPGPANSRPVSASPFHSVEPKLAPPRPAPLSGETSPDEPAALDSAAVSSPTLAGSDSLPFPTSLSTPAVVATSPVPVVVPRGPFARVFHSKLFQRVGFIAVLMMGIVYMLQHSVAKTAIKQVDPRVLQTVRRAAVETSVERIDEAFATHWASSSLQPAGNADSLLIMRRLSLALTGLPPSLEEIRWAESLPAEDRIDQYLGHLLEDPRSHDYLAERLARSWLGAENGPFIVFRRQRFLTWLAERLRANQPYDALVREMFGARGLWTDQGPVNFFTAQADGDQDNRIDLVRLTGRISRNFLGMRIDCLQCHDDFTGGTEFGSPEEPREGLQTDFHALAAFFGQIGLAPTGLHDRPQADPYSAELLGDTTPTVVPPAVPFGEQWLPSNDSPVTSPLRKQFSDWLTRPENRPFARAFVNRAWGIMFGRPLMDPVDNLPLHGPFPPGLEELTDEFIDSGYNIRHLISTIAHSQAFSRDSRSPYELTPEHEASWACFPKTKLRPEQMAGMISQAASLIALDDSTHIITQLVRFGEQNDFITRYGDLGDQEFEQEGETVSQRLLLLNGEMASERLSAQGGLPFNSVVQLDRLAPSPADKVKLAFLIVLSRTPTADELEAIVADVDRDGVAALEDLMAVLINSSEALWNH